MKSLNKVELIGRIGKDILLKKVAGQSVANLTIATSTSYKDLEGNWQDITEWHDVEIWRERAERLAKAGAKGMEIYIVGSLKTRKWQKDGQWQSKTSIFADDYKLFSTSTKNEVVEMMPNLDKDDSDLPF